jgi:uncharacterized membrane protein
MKTTRLEAFSDGVLAIIITIMVLEMKAPEGPNWSHLRPLLSVFLAYLMSFVYVGIYWNNHHHMLQATERVSGPVLWANLHLLFWLSLIPFTTRWMEQNEFASAPTVLYGAVLLMSALAYVLMQTMIVSIQGSNSKLQNAIGKDYKGKLSIALYLIAMASAFWSPWISVALYVLVALMWLIPDRRIEKTLKAEVDVTAQSPADD